MNRDHDGSFIYKSLAFLGSILSLCFIELQLVPIEGLKGVHFCWQSYLMLAVWCLIGFVFFVKQRKHFVSE